MVLPSWLGQCHILGMHPGHTISEVASLLKVSSEAVRSWLKRFLLRGVGGLTTKKSPGRPPKLTKPQKRELAKLIDEGPAKAGFLGNCWRSPMIQHLIHERFGMFYCVHYISQLLRNMGFSYQKARFVSDHLDKEKRKQWLNEKWRNFSLMAGK